MKQIGFLAVMMSWFVMASCTSNNDLLWSVKQEVQLTSGDNYLSPKFSPDDKKVAFSSSKYEGLWVKDLQTKETVNVSKSEGVGYNFSWSPDSASIVAREIMRNPDHSQSYRAVKFNVRTKKSEFLTDIESNIYTPSWNKDIVIVDRVQKTAKKISTQISTSQDTSKGKISVFSADENVWMLNLETNEQVNVSKTGGYAPVLSPDETKIAYLHGNNITVFDITDGKTYDLGGGSDPNWLPDSQYVVFVITEDNGHDILKSDIYISKFDGAEKSILAKTNDRVEQNPSWSHAGNKIVYNDHLTGNIYLLEIVKRGK